jgi:hypothetical protein
MKVKEPSEIEIFVMKEEIKLLLTDKSRYIKNPRYVKK